MTRRRSIRLRFGPLMLASFALAAVAGCSRTPAWPPEPAELRLGEDACAECRMLISDVRYAAQRVSREGAVEFFDDAGCLLASVRPRIESGAGSEPVEGRGPSRDGESDPRGVFVVTGDDATWTRADLAYVVQSTDITSPMGHGLLAFSSRDAAEAEAARHAGATASPFSSLLRERKPAAGHPVATSSGPNTP